MKLIQIISSVYPRLAFIFSFNYLESCLEYTFDLEQYARYIGIGLQ